MLGVQPAALLARVPGQNPAEQSRDDQTQIQHPMPHLLITRALPLDVDSGHNGDIRRRSSRLPSASLVSCPIALYPASSMTERIGFNRINRKTGNRLKQQNVDSETVTCLLPRY